MSVVYSYSFMNGDIRGDMFFIKHDNDSFTVIDCNLADGREDEILNAIVEESKGKTIKRFISTHPDKDHIFGLEKLIAKMNMPASNFYAVKNEVPADKNNMSLTKYIELLNHSDSAFIKAGLKRDFLNQDKANKGIGSANIDYYWPDPDDTEFKKAVEAVKNGGKANDICPIITYHTNNGARFLWMGDLESGMQEEYHKHHKGEIGKVNVLFAPHHGRESGQVPKDFLNELNPDIVVIGNAPVDDLKSSYKYYGSERTITQNSSKDILFECHDKQIDIYTGEACDNMPVVLKNDETITGEHYRGTLYI